jgi:hypothetical protein
VGVFIGTEAQLAASRKPKGRSKSGKAFDKEFARQRAAGAKKFTFGGKSYSTAVASGGGGGAAKSTTAAVKPKGAAGPTVMAKKTTVLPKPAPRSVKAVPTPTRRPDSPSDRANRAEKAFTTNYNSTGAFDEMRSGMKTSAAAAAVKSVPTPAPGRTGEILRIANRNKTNPPPANNGDVMKRVQESIAAGKPRSTFPGRPAGQPVSQPKAASRGLKGMPPMFGRSGTGAQAVAPTIENVSAAARAKAPGSPTGPRGSQVTSSFGQRTSSLLNPPTGATAKADRLPSRATADKTDRLQPKAVAAVKTTMPAKERFGRDKTRTRMSNKTLGLWRSN